MVFEDSMAAISWYKVRYLCECIISIVIGSYVHNCPQTVPIVVSDLVCIVEEF